MLAEAARAALAGIAVDVLIPEATDVAPIDVLRINAPAMARRHESFAITVSAHGRAGTRGVATLTGAGEPPRSAAITLAPDGLGSVTFAVTAREAGIKSY
jgi:hypothetical protein